VTVEVTVPTLGSKVLSATLTPPAGAGSEMFTWKLTD